jgi:hypothetical protein
MTHFIVLACLEDPGQLSEMLAPYDENREAAPYRSYEDGLPEEHWAVKSLRAEGKLPDGPLTWQQVADAVNVAYCQGADDEGDHLFLDEDTDRAYMMSTRNQQSKWDWYTVGGRWGGSLRYKPGHAGEVLMPEQSWSSPEKFPFFGCDGGPKRALDLEKVRQDAEDEARTLYREYQGLVAGLPEAVPFSVFAGMVSEGSGYTIERARQEYHSQLRVARLNAEGSPFRWSSKDVLEVFSVSEDEHARRQRDQAVPGYALLTTDGEWMAPGTMGWFGMSDDGPDDRAAYLRAANAYVDSLPDDAWLVVVDCHI